jgi:hypothetical protein
MMPERKNLSRIVANTAQVYDWFRDDAVRERFAELTRGAIVVAAR